MRTQLVLDDQLIRDAMRLTGVRTKREVVEVALRDLVARRRQRRLLDLPDTDPIAPDYDVRAARAGMAKRASRRGAG